MDQKNEFLFSTEKTSVIRQQILQRRQYESAEAAELWLERYEHCDYSDPEYDKPVHVIGVLLYAANSSDPVIAERTFAIWRRVRSVQALTELYYSWQDACLSESFTRFCSGILQIEHSSLEWVHQWQRWLTASNLQKVAAGCARTWCERHQTPLRTWAIRYQIQKGSLLDRLIDSYLQQKKEDHKQMDEQTIIKVTVDYLHNRESCRAVYENPDGIRALDMPNFDNKSVVTLSTCSGENYTISFKSLVALSLGDAACLSPEERESASILLDGRNFSYLFDMIQVTDKQLPSLTYADATEHLLLGLPYLPEETINGTTKGLWSCSGERVLSIIVKDPPFTTQDLTYSLDFDGTWDANEKPFTTVKRCSDTFYVCSIDTNILQEYMNPDKKAQTFKAWFTLSSDDYETRTKTSFSLPVKLFFNNSETEPTSKDASCIDKNHTVSIDFGTSSTCAAISTIPPSMIEMSPDENGKDSYCVYENPTFLMLYRWEQFAEIWNKQETQPVLRKNFTGGISPVDNTNSGEIYKGFETYSEELFEFGHAIKNTNSTEQKWLESVIMHLKMIPKMIEDGNTLIIRDYACGDETTLTCKKTYSSNEFNPIEFFGYLLGKAINHPNGNENKYYTKYILSFPVKFSESTKKAVKESLERGISRSLPEPVLGMENSKGKKLFQVTMKYPEPIACIGAVCGNELQLTEEEPCMLFGVFDFGGGTADYSFGMYRKADVDTEGFEEALELFGVDGDDTFGGELLIDKITYWILINEQNKDNVINQSIPFVKPADELKADGFGNLIQSTPAARANIRRISELISRPFFEGKRSSGVDFTAVKYIDNLGRTTYTGTATCEIGDLKSTNNSNTKLTLTINFDDLNAKLKDLFEKKCKVFIQSMDHAFSTQKAENKLREAGIEDPRSSIRIVLAGNSSRHPLVRETLKELLQFDDKVDRIFLIGEKSDDTGMFYGTHYKITPKTAVAIGALKLSQIRVYDSEDLSIIYVAIQDKGARLKLLLGSDIEETRWHRSGPVQNNEFRIYYNSNPDTENANAWRYHTLDFEDSDVQLICWIRRSEKGRDAFEYIGVPIGYNPNEEDYCSDGYDAEEFHLS